MFLSGFGTGFAVPPKRTILSSAEEETTTEGVVGAMVVFAMVEE